MNIKDASNIELMNELITRCGRQKAPKSIRYYKEWHETLVPLGDNELVRMYYTENEYQFLIKG